MTRIRVTCTVCEAEPMLLPAAIIVVIVGGRDEVADGSAYKFTCPTCGTRIVRAADRRVVGLLEQAGCRVKTAGQMTSSVVDETHWWPPTAWVGRFACGHDGAGHDTVPPAPGGWHICDVCGRTRELVDVIVGRKATA